MHVCSNACSQSPDDLIKSRNTLAIQIYEEFIFIFVQPGWPGLNVDQVYPLFLKERGEHGYYNTVLGWKVMEIHGIINGGYRAQSSWK